MRLAWCVGVVEPLGLVACRTQGISYSRSRVLVA